MLEKVVAKMQCHNNKQTREGDEYHQIVLGCVYEGYEKDKLTESAIFGKYTPFGECRMAITNPAANEFFKEGKKYYVTFTEAPD